MQFLTILALAGAAVAIPANIARQVAPLCSGLTGSAQCCATDVLGLADLNCDNRESPCTICSKAKSLTRYTAPTVPTTTEEFVNSCSAIGQQARCCAIPIVSLRQSRQKCSS
jgi:hypothetical protein